MSTGAPLTNAMLKDIQSDAFLDRGYATDLDTCFIPGYYILRVSDAVCANPPNIPNWNLGFLEVLRRSTSTYLHRITTVDGLVVFRIWTNGQWRPWNKVTTTQV